MKRIEFEPVTDELLADITKVIVETVRPAKVILFGSYASGTPDEDSDLDLLIIEDEEFGENRSRFDETHRIRQALRRFFLPKDILVVGRKEAEFWADTTNHVVARAFREGRILYERP